MDVGMNELWEWGFKAMAVAGLGYTATKSNYNDKKSDDTIRSLEAHRLHVAENYVSKPDLARVEAQIQVIHDDIKTLLKRG